MCTTSKLNSFLKLEGVCVRNLAELELEVQLKESAQKWVTSGLSLGLNTSCARTTVFALSLQGTYCPSIPPLLPLILILPCSFFSAFHLHSTSFLALSFLPHLCFSRTSIPLFSSILSFSLSCHLYSPLHQFQWALVRFIFPFHLLHPLCLPYYLHYLSISPHHTPITGRG